MVRVLAFDEEQLAGPATPELVEQLVAMDAATGVAEILFEHMMPEVEGWLGPMVRRAEPLEPVLPVTPFRATVVPRRMRGLEDRPPLLPGSRAVARLRPRSADRELVLTDLPVRVTATGAQPLELAAEVLEADELTLELRVLGLEAAAGGPEVTVELQTGMQRDSSVGWVSCGAFPPVSAAPSAQLRRFGQLLRYVRWNVSALTGSSATFFVSGVPRRWAREAARQD